jgi:excisionase family DNA binding protein
MAQSHSSQQRRLDSLNSAAEYAGVHVATIRRWISTGRLTGYRLGPRLIKVDLDQIDAMLQPIGGHV